MPLSPHDSPPGSSGTAQTQPLSTDTPLTDVPRHRTTSLLTPLHGLNPRVKYLVAMLVGAVAALVISSLASSLTQGWTAPGRKAIVPIGGAELVRQETLRPQQATRSFRSSSNPTTLYDSIAPDIGSDLPASNDVPPPNVSPEERSRWQSRRDEEHSIAERQRLEDQKRLIERELEDQQMREKRRLEDKLLAEQRAQEEKQRQEQYTRDDSQAPQNQTPTPVSPLTSMQ